MTYYRIKKTCPHCHKVISREIRRNLYQELYGNPFRKCPHCQRTYVDNEIKEPACSPYKEPPTSFSSCILSTWLNCLLALSLFVIFLILLSQKNSHVALAFFSLLCGLLLLIPTWFFYKNRHHRRDQYISEWHASKQRLSDPEYSFKLYQAGIPVPQEYLSTIKNRVDEYDKILAEETKKYEWAKKVVYEFGKNHPAVSEIAKIKGVSKNDVIDHYESIIRNYNNKHRN